MPLSQKGKAGPKSYRSVPSPVLFAKIHLFSHQEREVHKLSLGFCPGQESGLAALCISSNLEIVKILRLRGRLAASWGCWSEPWVVRNVSGLSVPSVPGRSLWINDPSPGGVSRGPDARHGASSRLYTLGLLSSEAPQGCWGLIINIL